jgi:hypothetical protein
MKPTKNQLVFRKKTKKAPFRASTRHPFPAAVLLVSTRRRPGVFRGDAPSVTEKSRPRRTKCPFILDLELLFRKSVVSFVMTFFLLT